MTNTQCFKMKPNTKYASAVKDYHILLPRWDKVMIGMNEFMGENITRIGIDPERFQVDVQELTLATNKNLFTKEGDLKKNRKAATAMREHFDKLVADEGLTTFKDLRYINFVYGLTRMRGQKKESFYTEDSMGYYKCDFDLSARTDNIIESITEIEYEEAYLHELKKHNAQKV